MMLQLDLFAAQPRPVRPDGVMLAPVPPPMPLPKRTPEWEAMLLGSDAAGNVVVLVSTLFTGVCLEVLSDPVLGRRWLHRDGSVGEFPADSAHGRTVHATPDEARAWHKARALVPLGSPGTSAARFTFGDTPGTGELQLSLAAP